MKNNQSLINKPSFLLPIAFLLLLFVAYIVLNFLFGGGISVKITNLSKTVTHNVILEWPNGHKKFTIGPAKVINYKIKDFGENSLLLKIEKSSESHALTGYITSDPDGSIEAYLDSKGFLRSQSNVGFIFDTNITKCDRTSCLY